MCDIPTDIIVRVRGTPGFEFPISFVDYVPISDFLTVLSVLEDADCIHDLPIPELQDFDTSEDYLAIDAEFRIRTIYHTDTRNSIKNTANCIECELFDLSYDIWVRWYTTPTAI